MADKKISQLTGATTPLAGTEVLPIVQGGSTVKVSAANITAGRDVSMAGLTATGNVSLDGGSFVFNESGADKDFRIEGDAQANLFVVDASADKIGVGIGAPLSQVHVELPGTDNIISAVGQNGYEGVVYLSGAGSGKDTSIVLGNGRDLNFKTTATATPTSSGTTVLRIASNNVTVRTDAGLGYGTGAGGAVEQTSSRTSTVEINKPSGAITLVSAAGTTAWTTFTVQNNRVLSTDVINICQKSGTDKYMINVTSVSNGSFDVTFATTGGATTEQPVFNFALLRTATA